MTSDREVSSIAGKHQRIPTTVQAWLAPLSILLSACVVLIRRLGHTRGFRALTRRLDRGRWRPVLGLALVLAVLGAVVSPAMATHLRGALGETTYDPGTNKVTINSVLLQAKNWTSADTFFAFPTIYRIDRTTGATTVVKACTGQNTAASYTYSDTTAQPLFDINTTTFVIDVSCSTFGTNFDYAFTQTAGNRINGIRNSTNQTIEVESRIRIDGTNAAKAPIYNAGLMTNVTYDAAAGHYFTAGLNALAGGYTGTVAVNSAVTYSLITDQSSSALGAYGAGRIPCSDFNTTTGILRIGSDLCIGTENYATAFNGGTDTAPIYYAFKTRATDAAGQYMTRDVLLAFSNTSNTRPTLTFTPAGQTKSIPSPNGASTAIDVNFTAADVDAAQTLAFATNTLPSYVTMTNTSTSVASSSGTSLTGTLHIAPPAGTNTVLQLVVSAYDVSSAANFFSLSASQQIDVQIGSGVLPPGSPGKPVVSTVSASYASGGVNVVDATFSFTAPTVGGVVSCYTVRAVSTDGTSTLDSVTSPSAPCTGNTTALTRTITGLIAGKTYNIIATARNAAGSADSPPSDNTGLAAPNISLSKTSITLQKDVAGGSNFYTVTNSGGALDASAAASGSTPSKPYSLSPNESTLPAGLTFSRTTGLISGTPTVNFAATAYTLTASGPGGTSSVGFVLGVGLKAQSITFIQPWGMAIPSSGTAKQKLYSVTSANATVNGNISYTVDSGSSSVCSISSGVVNVASTATAGACTVTASATGVSGYADAVTVSKTFYVFSASTKPSATSCISGSGLTWSQPPVIYAVAYGYAYNTPSTYNPISTLDSFVYGTAVSNKVRIINAGAPGANFDASGLWQGACNKSTTLSVSGGPAGVSTVSNSTSTYGELTGTPSAIANRANATITETTSSSSSSTGSSLIGTLSLSMATVGKTQTITFAQPANKLLSDGTQALTASTNGTSTTSTSRTLSGKQITSGTARLYFSSTQGFAVGNAITVSNSSSSIRSSSNCSGQSYKAYWLMSGGNLSTTVTAIGTDVTKGSWIEYNLTTLSGYTYCDQSYSSQTQGTVSRTDTVALAVTLTSNTGSVCTVSGTTVTFQSAGTCSITASQGGTSTYAAAAPVTRTFTITAPPQISLNALQTAMTAGSLYTQPYTLATTGGSAPTSYAMTAGVVPDGMSFSTTTGILSGTPEAGAPSRTIYIQATNAAGTSNIVSFTYTVAKRAQALRFDQPNAMVVPSSTTIQSLTAIADSGLDPVLTVNSLTVCHIDPTNLTTVVVDRSGLCSVTATQAGSDAVAAATPVSRSFQVLDADALVAPQLVFDDGTTRTSGTYEVGRPAFFPFTIVNKGGPADANSFVISPTLPTGFHFDDNTGEITQTDSTASMVNQTYSITASNAEGTSNTITFQSIIAKRQQVITFTAPGSHKASDADFAPGATASSSLTVTYTASPASVCSIVSGRVHLNAAGGTCNVTASQAGNTTYDAAPDQVRSFNVVGPPSLAFSSTELQFYAGESIGAPYTITQSGDPATLFTSSVAMPAGITLDTATGLISGTPTSTQSRTKYTLTGVGSAGNTTVDVYITISQHPQTITFPKPNGMQTGSSQALAATVDSPKTVTHSTSTPTTCTVAGSVVTATSTAGTCTITASVAGDTSYLAATDVSQSFSVYSSLPAPSLAISASSVTMKVNVDPGTPYTVTNNGGTATYKIGLQSSPNTSAMPENMTFDTSNGQLAGVPQTAKTATIYRITATNATGSAYVDVTITVDKGDATVSLDATSLSKTYDGTAKSAAYVSVDTNDTNTTAFVDGLARDGSSSTVSFTYNGSATAPTAAGSYPVLAIINDANFQGSSTGTLVIAKAAAAISMSSASVVYNGSARHLSPTSTTVPSGTYNITYNGSSTEPTNAGTYSVQAVLSNANYTGSATGTLTITKATATITPSDLTQAYTGDGLEPTVTTAPQAGLSYSITFNGSDVLPSAVGSYATDITIDDPNYEGTASTTFTITKAAQTLSWSVAPADSAVGVADATIIASATSGLAPTYSVSPSSVCTLVAGKVHPVAAGTCLVSASQAGNASYNAATTLTASITIAATIAAPNLTVDDHSSKSKTITSFKYSDDVTAPYVLYNDGGRCDSYSISPRAPAGLVFNRNDGSLTGTPTAVTTRSIYRIRCTNVTNYSDVNVDLEVAKADQSVIWAQSTTVTYGDSDSNLDGSSSAALAVSYNSDDSTVAAVDGTTGTLKFLKPGTVHVTASQSGNTNFNAANSVVKTITVLPKHLDVSGVTVTRSRHDGSLSFSGGSLTGVVGSDAATVDLSSTAGTPDANGDVTLTTDVHLAGANSGNYVLNQPSLRWSWGPYSSQSIHWTPNTTVTYGDGDSSLDGTATSSLSVAYNSDDSSVVKVESGKLKFLKPGTVHVTASQSGDNEFDAASSVQRTITVQPKTLSVSGITVKRDRKTHALEFTGGTLSGVVGTDDAGVDLSAVAGNAETNGDVTLTGNVGLSGTSHGNYQLTQPTLHWDWGNKYSQQITWAPTTSVTYGDSDINLDGTSDSNLAVSYNSDDDTTVKVESGKLKFLKPGTVHVHANQSGDDVYDGATAVDKTIVVSPKHLNVSGITVVRDPLTNQLTFTGGSLSGVVGSDDAGVDLTDAAGTANSDGTVTLTGNVKVSGNSRTNYLLNQPSLTWTWGSAQNQTLSWSQTLNFIYGDNDVTPIATATSGLTPGFLSGDTTKVTIRSGKLHFVGVGSATVTATQSGNLAYNAAPSIDRTVTVSAKNLTVINITVTKDPTTGVLTFSGGQLVGVVGSDDVRIDLSGLTGTADSSGNVTLDSGALAALLGSKAGNYTLTQPTGLQVTSHVKSNQTISAPSGVSVVYGATKTLSATATSGLAVTYQVETASDALCSVSGKVVTAKSFGDCRIVVSQAGDDDFNAAPDVTMIVSIKRAARTITVTTGGSLIALQSRTLEPRVSDNESVTAWTTSTSAVCSIDSQGRVTALAAGTCRLVVSAPASNHYNAASVAISITIVRAKPAESVVVDNPSLQVGGSTGLSIDGPVTSGSYAILSGDAYCDINGSQVVAVAKGSCVVVAISRQTDQYATVTTDGVTITITVPNAIPAPTVQPDPVAQSSSILGPVTPVGGSTTAGTPASSTTTTNAGGIAAVKDVAERTVDQVSSEKIKGFTSGSSVQLDVIGAKTTAALAIPPSGYIDITAIRDALTNSASSTDFVQVLSAANTSNPSTNGIRIASLSKADTDVFNAIGLEAPRLLTQISTKTAKNWVTFSVNASTYKPGSIIYLAMTSRPIVFATAVVGADGKATLKGDMPMSLLPAGVHKLRVIGNRQVGKVSVGADGTVNVTDSVLKEVQRFDTGTNVTVRIVGAGAAGAAVSAIRIIPLVPYVPWWLLWIFIALGVLLLLSRIFGIFDRRGLSWVKRGVYTALGLTLGIVGLLVESIPFAVWSIVVTAIVVAGSFMPRFGKK